MMGVARLWKEFLGRFEQAIGRPAQRKVVRVADTRPIASNLFAPWLTRDSDSTRERCVHVGFVDSHRHYREQHYTAHRRAKCLIAALTDESDLEKS